MTRTLLPPSRANVVFGYFLVSMAVSLSEGYFSTQSVLLLLTGIFLFLRKKEIISLNSTQYKNLLKGTLVIFIAVIFFQWLWLFSAYPVAEEKLRHIHITLTPSAKLLVLVMTLCLFVTAVIYVVREPRLKIKNIFFLTGILYLALMGFSLCIFHDPPIDAFDLFQTAGEGLHKGLNPYELLYTNIYHHSNARQLVHDPRYQNSSLDAFDYFPGIFPFLWLADFWGDVRFLFLLFHFGFSLLLFSLAGGEREGALWALLYLLNPITIYLLTHSFLDPLLVFSMGLFVFCMVRKKDFYLPLIFGYTLCVKQYAVFLPLVFWRFLSRKVLFFSLLAGMFFLSLVFLWSPSDFAHDVILRPFRMLPREDGLSLYAFLYHFKKAPLSWHALPILSISVFIVLSSRKLHLKHMLYSTGIAYLLFFFFSHVAFINYYYFALSFIPLSQVLPSEINTAKNTP